MPESTLQRKIRQYRRIKALLPTLERDIRDGGFAIMKEQGVLAKPRLERVIEQFG